MRDKYGVVRDPNCYPDTDTLINLLNIESESELYEAELELTSFRLDKFSPSFSNLTFEYLKNIHYYLFQDIYSWADLTPKVNSSCRPYFIRPQPSPSIFQLSNLLK